MNRVFFILYSLIIGCTCGFAEAPDKNMTEVVDTLQIGRHVVEISLPTHSIIGIGKKPDENGGRYGIIFLDSIPSRNNYIAINDISMASCCGIGYRPDNESHQIETQELPNTFTVNLFSTPEGYLIEAVSGKYSMSFTYSPTRTAADAKSIMPIFESIRILPMGEYDNTKSARRKMRMDVR